MNDVWGAQYNEKYIVRVVCIKTDLRQYFKVSCNMHFCTNVQHFMLNALSCIFKASRVLDLDDRLAFPDITVRTIASQTPSNSALRVSCVIIVRRSIPTQKKCKQLHNIVMPRFVMRIS